MSETIVIVTGGFDPIHSGHIEYFKCAKEYGDRLFVGLNSDDWLTRKKGKPFLNSIERHIIVSSIRYVDLAFSFLDDDNSAIDAIRTVRNMAPNAKIIFANGGDRTNLNIPEMNCGIDNVEFVFGIGGSNKKNSSSWILNNWNNK